MSSNDDPLITFRPFTEPWSDPQRSPQINETRCLPRLSFPTTPINLASQPHRSRKKMDHTFNFTLSGFAYPHSVFILAKSTNRISGPSVHGINPSERCSSPGFYTPFEASGSLTVFSATQPRGSKCRMQLQSFAPLAKLKSFTGY